MFLQSKIRLEFIVEIILYLNFFLLVFNLKYIFENFNVFRHNLVSTELLRDLETTEKAKLNLSKYFDKWKRTDGKQNSECETQKIKIDYYVTKLVYQE